MAGEFKGDVTKMLEKNEIKIRRVMTKYKHTHTAFVEALNKILAERLFKVQDAQELNDPEKVSSRWVKHLYGLVDELNDMDSNLNLCDLSQCGNPVFPRNPLIIISV